MKLFPASQDWGLDPSSFFFFFFHEQRRKKGETHVKARLAIWKGGAFLLPLIAHSPRPVIRLQSEEIAGVGVRIGWEQGKLEGPRELHNEINACSVLGLLI